MPGGLEITPRDELTGLPLPVLVKSADYYLRRADYHHHFHPKKSEDLGYDDKGNKLPGGSPERIEGRALRQSRGQYLPTWLHDRYHDIFYGPHILQDSSARYTAVILACAGVVPREAISLYRHGEASTVQLSPRQHKFISERTHYEGAHSKPRYNKRENIGKYIASYALENSLSAVMSESAMFMKAEEFMDEKDPDRKLEVARDILTYAVDASVADLVDIHRQVKQEGMIHKSTRKLGEVALDYFPEKRFADYVEPLESRLATILI